MTDTVVELDQNPDALQIAFARLRLHVMRLTFSAQKGVQLPSNLPSIWRSALGPVLSDHAPDLHQRMYFPEVPDHIPKRFSSVPKLYSIISPSPAALSLQPKDRYEIQVTLFGDLVEEHERLVDLFGLTGEIGIGTGRAPMMLEAVAHSAFRLSDLELPAVPDAARVVFISPMRLKDGRAKDKIAQQAMKAESFRVEAWLEAMSLRANLLACVSEGGVFPKDLKVPSIAIHEVGLANVVQARKTRRLRGEIDTSGVVGSFLLPMKGLEPYWPAIWCSQWLQAGAMTTAGNGVTRIHPVSI